jgi:cob(I)alamin adenosyltransferase
MKIYTKTGDGGLTSIRSGRVSKTSPIIEAIGAIDELDAFVGDAYAKGASFDVKLSDNDDNDSLLKIGSLLKSLQKIQYMLYVVQGVLCEYQPVDEEKILSEVEFLENKIDEFTQAVPPLKNFIRPGVTDLDAKLHLCRVICRRAERRLWSATRPEPSTVDTVLQWYYYYFPAVSRSDSYSPHKVVLQYMNRLSDFFFAAARYVTYVLGEEDDVLKQ